MNYFSKLKKLKIHIFFLKLGSFLKIILELDKKKYSYIFLKLVRFLKKFWNVIFKIKN